MKEREREVRDRRTYNINKQRGKKLERETERER